MADQPLAFIMHHTGGRGDPQGVVNWWQKQGRGYGAQYIMDRNGVVHDTQKEFDYGGTNEILNDQTRGLSNSNVVGMEIIAKNDADVTPQQAAAAAAFIRQNYPNTPVYGHGMVNPGHKEATEGLTATNAVYADRGLASPYAAAPSPVPATASAPNTAPASPPAAPTGVASYIAQRAREMGIDPNIALRVARAEGLNAFNPNAPDRGGDGGSSFGPFQLHYGGINPKQPGPGLGDEFTQATGLDARNPSTWRQQVDFALSRAGQGGWGPWSGAKAAGVSEMAGIGQGGAPAAQFPASAAAPVPGTTITSVPPDPTIAAGGPGHLIPGVASTAVAAGAPTVTPTVTSTVTPTVTPTPVVPPGQAAVAAVQQGDIGGALKALTAKTGDQGQGKSPLENMTSAFGGGQQQQQAAPSMLPSAPPPQMDMSMAPVAGQLLSQIIAQSQRPLTWSSRPFGSGSAGPQIPGVTLSNSGYSGYG